MISALIVVTFVALSARRSPSDRASLSPTVPEVPRVSKVPRVRRVAGAACATSREQRPPLRLAIVLGLAHRPHNLPDTHVAAGHESLPHTRRLTSRPRGRPQHRERPNHPLPDRTPTRRASGVPLSTTEPARRPPGELSGRRKPLGLARAFNHPDEAVCRSGALREPATCGSPGDLQNVRHVIDEGHRRRSGIELPPCDGKHHVEYRRRGAH